MTEPDRLGAIIEVLDKISTGDFSSRVSAGEMDDIGKIAVRINMMIDDLEEAQEGVQQKARELARLNQDLEAKVDARTRELQDKLNLISNQSETIESLSTPVVRIWKEILALPLVGVLDSMRAQHAMEACLDKIIEDKARIIIIDITGVPVVDSLVANYLSQTLAAAKLIGAQGILTGISANVAQTLVKLGVDFELLKTRNTLEEGLRWAFEILGIR